MYEPAHVRRRRFPFLRILLTVLLLSACISGTVVAVMRALPKPPPTEPLTLDDLAMLIPDAAQTQIVAAMVKTRIATANASPKPAAKVPCRAPTPPHTWGSTQRNNALTIVEVGLALGISRRGLVVALATAMQESQLYNAGYQGPNNDHDSLGLFQQRPSQGWGSTTQVMDPVFSSTAFFLALQRVAGWESMKLTVAAQRVQRSAFPNAYAKWETDATALTQQILCTEPAGLQAQAPLA